MNILRRLNQVRGDLPATVRLVAVSKFQSTDAIRQAFDAGQLLFGESRAQELIAKYEFLPKIIEWHFIGHLQINKVKCIAAFISMVQSVDSVRLLEELNRQAERHQRRIRVLLQIHIAQEEGKTGFSFDEAEQVIAGGLPAQFPHLIFCGLMGIATLTDDKQIIRREFESLAAFYRRMKPYFPGRDFKELSMGMSDDYPLAIKAGCTLIRIGTRLFGPRAEPDRH
jgi:pyridoxal phosphate enzyme (YggS family)